MGLFSKKKPKNALKDEQSSARFPDIPTDDDFSYDSPNFDKDAKDIKQGVNSGMFDDFDIPIRKPKAFDEEKTFGPQMPSMDADVKRAIKEERPVFIKLDKYKNVIKSINEMKKKIEETQEIISKLDQAKKEEDEQLQKWHSDLEALKERLLSIDSTLFEE
ncbi:MAG: hypothetical protein PHG05_02365 [Candidatus Nanoarchaeia archaeon]|nr:hypothetical protein [Candidatus Nanoarchaeia archaeon]